MNSPKPQSVLLYLFLLFNRYVRENGPKIRFSNGDVWQSNFHAIE